MDELLAGAFVVAIVALGAWRLRMPRMPAALVVAATIVRCVVGLSEANTPIDLAYHAHNLKAVAAGEAASGKYWSSVGDRKMIKIPYPPLLYASLAPFIGEPPRPSAPRAIRIAQTALECFAPLLVFLIARGLTRGDRDASGWAAAAMAVMPEGTLVLVKGIATNILGTFLTLALVAAIVGPAPKALVAVLSGLAFGSHPGAALALGVLVASWSALELRGSRPRVLLPMLVPLAAGVLLSWLLYYDKVWGIVVSSLSAVRQHAASDEQFWQVRWVHLGKIAQNLVLKFGLAPAWLAAAGLRRARPAGGSSLIPCWLGVAAFFAIVAVVTPFAIRFEYFATAAVALAAGPELVRWAEGRPSRFAFAMAIPLALQLLVAWAALTNRFLPISVIIPSPRWPFPFRL